MWFANNFSHSVSCPFTLLIIYFAMQKVFSLMESHLFIFNFAACALGCHIKKIIDKTHVNKVFPIFVVSGLNI